MSKRKLINRKHSSTTKWRNNNAQVRRERLNIINELESIEKLIVANLNEFDRQQNSTTNKTLPFVSQKRTLKEIFDDFRKFDDQQRREYRTIGVGDEKVKTTKKIRRRSKRLSVSPVIRTIRTRSSTANALNETSMISKD